MTEIGHKSKIVFFNDRGKSFCPSAKDKVAFVDCMICHYNKGDGVLGISLKNIKCAYIIEDNDVKKESDTNNC